MSYKIIKDRNYLHQKTFPVKSVEEGQEIADKLIKTLNELNSGFGLAANQIGILKSVAIVSVRKDAPPVILMNPIVVDYSKEKLIYLESCLSLPGKRLNTERHLKVTVSTLNHANPLPFGPDKEPVTSESIGKDYGILEAICVQHEIDHLNGKLAVDRGIKFINKAKKKIKYGRNDKVMVEKDGETQFIKYKKALEFINLGWKIL